MEAVKGVEKTFEIGGKRQTIKIPAGVDNGSRIRFDDNAGVILSAETPMDPAGTRIFGPIAREVKNTGYAKIASLAEEVL